MCLRYFYPLLEAKTSVNGLCLRVNFCLMHISGFLRYCRWILAQETLHPGNWKECPGLHMWSLAEEAEVAHFGSGKHVK